MAIVTTIVFVGIDFAPQPTAEEIAKEEEISRKGR
jgi:hypothetical protein